jgi:hypothetical protein
MSTPGTGSVEAFVPLNGSAGNSAPITGGRRHKLKVVTRKQARKLLKKLGKKMRGGEDGDAAAVIKTTNKDETALGGRRRGHTKKTHRRGRSLFGMKY